MSIIGGILVGAIAWFLVRYLATGFYTVNQNERAVKTSFGRAERIGSATIKDDPISESLRAEDRERYAYPQVRVIPPGGPYFKWPWERVYKASIATQTINMAVDPETPEANQAGTVLEAVTKDQLNTGLTGQIRYRVSEKNLYAYIFGVKRPIVHVMGYFTSVLRERIANFEAPNVSAPQTAHPIPAPELAAAAVGISINDLRKNLSSITRYMEEACRKTTARYGVELDAALITTIDPPGDVDEALASINTTQNQVAAAISQSKADADQKLKMAEQAVQIAQNRAAAEAAPLTELGKTLAAMHATGGKAALDAYLRNASLPLREKAAQTVVNL